MTPEAQTDRHELDAEASTAQARTWRRLMAAPWQFDFVQAVWLLERAGMADKPVGGRGPVQKESIRFRPDVSVGFPATDLRRLARLRRTDGGDLYQMEVSFLGLYGVSTPLPLHYAINVLRSVDPFVAAPAPGAEASSPGAGGERARQADATPVRDFLDILHHRLISLFYRAATKYRYETTFGMPDRDAITPYLLWLIGLGPEIGTQETVVSPERMLRYAGLLTQRPRSAVGLEGLLRDYWDDMPVRVEQYVGRWVPLGPDDENRLGQGNCGLGVDMVIGSQVFDWSGAFNVVVGPVDWEGFQQFLPDGRRHRETRALTQLYCMDPLWFSVEVELAPGQVPKAQLSSDDGAARLGFTSWIRTEEMPATSVVFDESSVQHGTSSEAADDLEVAMAAAGGSASARA